MALTEKQLAARQGSIGGSDVPAILNISPFKSAADIYIEKMNGVTRVENKAMEAGHMLEPAVIDWALTKIKKGREFSWTSANVRRTQVLVASTGEVVPAHANLDFMFMAAGDYIEGNQGQRQPETREGLEAKTTGISKSWGPEGTDQIPDHVLAQCLWQSAVAELDKVHIGVLIGDRGFHLKVYVIDPSEYKEELQEIIDRVAVFWNKNILEGIAPDETLPKIETLKRMVRVPNKTTKLPEVSLKSWLAAREELTLAKKKESKLRGQILSDLGDAEEGTGANGVLTYYESKRKEYVVPENAFRVLKWKSNKEG